MKKLLLLIIAIVFTLNIYAPNHSLEYRKEFNTKYIQILEKQRVLEEINTLENSEFSIKNLVKYLKLKQVNHSKIIIKQAILESGWFKSMLFKKGNNLFGMKVPKIRNTLAIGSLYGHAKYKHWTDSVKDYLIWQTYCLAKIKNIDNYYTFLNSVGYAEDSQYIHILKRININAYT